MFPSADLVQGSLGGKEGNIGEEDGSMREDDRETCSSDAPLLIPISTSVEFGSHGSSILIDQSLSIMGETLFQRFRLPCFALGIFICYFLFGIFQEKM